MLILQLRPSCHTGSGRFVVRPLKLMPAAATVRGGARQFEMVCSTKGSSAALG